MVKIRYHQRKGSIKNISYERLFAICYFMNMLLRPIIVLFSSYSTIILMFAVSVMLVIFILKQGTSINRNLIGNILFISSITMLFLINYLVRPNAWTVTYFTSFVIAGVVPLLFLARVKQYEIVLYEWSKLAVVVGVLFVLDPLFQYRWSGGYMPFGFTVMLPAFTGSLVLWMHFKEKYGWMLVLFFIELFICGNKGTLLTAIVIFIIANLFLNDKVKFSFGKFLGITICGIGIFIIRESIIDGMIQIAKALSLSSYSLRTLKIMLGDNADYIYDARLDIWNVAISKIKEGGLFGSGIGCFTSFYGTHPHNFFLDIGMTFGIVGLVISIFLITWCLIKIIRSEDKEKKIFFGMFLFMWIVPLMISLTFWQHAPFWCFLGILFTDTKNKNYIRGEFNR